MTAVAQGAIITSVQAGEDLSDKQFYFVKFSGSTVVACSAATDVPAGVLQNTPESGQQAEIVVIGPTKIEADAALSVGYLIGPSADGQADRKIPGTDTTEYVAGTVFEVAGAAGDIVRAWVNCAAPHRAA
jgi:hypothetical protein